MKGELNHAAAGFFQGGIGSRTDCSAHICRDERRNTPAPKYDKSAEVKVKGIIDDVITAPDTTVHITLKSDTGSLDVVIGPEKFLKAMEVSYSKGDAVEVLGSKVVVNGNALMVAREVTRNGEVLCARDPRGEPVWVGWIK